MQLVKPLVKSALRPFKLKPWILSKIEPTRLSLTHLLEEEHCPTYEAESYYPMRLGEILNNKYQVCMKFGWGTTATVWVARDLDRWRWQDERFVTLKIKTNNYPDKESAERELSIIQKITNKNSKHIGYPYVQHLLDSFNLEGPHGNHVCLVLKPLKEPLWILKSHFVGEVFPFDAFRLFVEVMLHSLDYLHRECQIIHTDLKLDNIICHFGDISVLEQHARDELQNPRPQKILSDRTIYLSRNDFGIPEESGGTSAPTITDFSSAIGEPPEDQLYTQNIQPDGYTAPEVALVAGWTYSADIWNFGVMLWDLIVKNGLFDAHSSTHNPYTPEIHMAKIIALLGRPPEELLQNGQKTPDFFHADGTFKHPALIPKTLTFASSLASIDIPDAEKYLFIAFARRMLQWLPSNRATAHELLQDPWILEGVRLRGEDGGKAVSGQDSN